MAAPVLYENPSQIKTGPGQIFMAPPGTDLPTFAATASKFSNAWTDWVPVGFTDDGLTFTQGRTAEGIQVAESLVDIRKTTTGVQERVSFSPAGINETNFSLAMNGGTWSTVGAGTGATLVRKFAPPEIGQEARVMLGWVSEDLDEAFVWYKCFQTAESSMARQKGTAKASLTGLQFDIEPPDPLVSTDRWNYYTAGEWAGATDALL
jgi:hypothetical protein